MVYQVTVKKRGHTINTLDIEVSDREINPGMASILEAEKVYNKGKIFDHKMYYGITMETRKVSNGNLVLTQ